MSHASERALVRFASIAGAEHARSGDGQPVEALRDAHARASELVAGIAADAAVDPELYLRTTVVPEGGE